MDLWDQISRGSKNATEAAFLAHKKKTSAASASKQAR
jgi:hypothetical protein